MARKNAEQKWIAVAAKGNTVHISCGDSQALKQCVEFCPDVALQLAKVILHAVSKALPEGFVLGYGLNEKSLEIVDLRQ